MNDIDAHVHVWSDDIRRYPLLPGAPTAHMDLPRFSGEDVFNMIRPHGFERAVLVQSSFYGDDHSLLTDTIASYPAEFRGIAALGDSTPGIIHRMRELAVCGVRGFRIIQLNLVNPRWLDTPGYEAMFRCAADEGLLICPLIDPGAMLALAAMCRRFPKAGVVIDHMARIGAGGVIREEDAALLATMAELPNVFVKVSGFWALGRAKPPYDDLVPLIRRLRDAFGAERLMWASDGPYGMTRGSYADAVSLVRERLDYLSDAERAMILGGTAERVFFTG